MRVIIAGSRDITDYNLVTQAIKESNFAITEIVCGAAQGVVSLGERYAKENNIKLSYFYANWKEYGKAAGSMRNEVMGNYSDALIAVWNGYSNGTKHMINFMEKHKKPVYIKYLTNSNLEKFFGM